MKAGLFLLILLLILGALAYVRLAPTNAARWHIDPASAADPGRAGTLRRHRAGLAPMDALARFDAVACAAPRVALLAGSVDEGRLTYEIRSKWFGFPDYLTVTAIPRDDGATLVMLSRLRFGRSDSGVNGARLDLWLQRFEAAKD